MESLSSNHDKKTGLLRKELEEILAPLVNMPDMFIPIKKALSTRLNDLIITTSQKPWPILPLTVAESISGKYEHVAPAAMAIQLLMAAGDVFDDIEDSDAIDSIPFTYGIPLAINLATTMLILGETALTSLKTKGNDPLDVSKVIKQINSYFTKSCIGQHFDLSNTSMDSTEKTYFDMIDLKSASQIECCCYAGAALSTADERIIDLLCLFGRNLGIAAQISNDIKGITNNNDIIKRKITLPLLFALRHSDKESIATLKNAYITESSNNSDCEMIKAILFNSGAMQYTSIQMSLYQENAKEIIPKLQNLGISTSPLSCFIN
ncbi:Geranylgeranyl pyrophosphate synthase [Dehalogenimonas formicexedens]|uniref:Geranylgeranyl pyrophosphate synthase n=1 Tax=Dehalogenimonas formicexedens TaxID=1839801 RepID=A0A1P8F6P2_9CHLR|nr:polyprenyl synthetase family protein [Dehalogenimonas formicexedens]APV44151.1 Geranylgeranyl pyrophosphate synthase [Dehalogenimonas formicexedens]